MLLVHSSQAPQYTFRNNSAACGGGGIFTPTRHTECHNLVKSIPDPLHAHARDTIL
ncbi:hypothetical protein DOS86_01900 [Anaplasma marginale]|uniref:hypothetical protein n=1 Tax=Anaplasma marginale TaxID=770 RepID=UPI0009B63EB5|nr:hypothetical protein DOS86_01900 [Anaplasma marginale]